MVILLISYPVNSESTAKIYEIEYPDKVYSGESAKLIFTIFNPSLEDPVNNHPRFFLRLELDGVLVEDELSRSWECPKGQSVERVIVLSSLVGPQTHQVLCKLYWLNQSVAVIQDTRSLQIQTIKLMVSEFQSSLNEVSLGKKEATPFYIQFLNRGNDVMYDTKLSVQEDTRVYISPQQVNLGDLQPNTLIKADFSIVIDSTRAEGDIETFYTVMYNDYRGTTHTEEFKVTINLQKGIVNIQLTLSEAEVIYNSGLSISVLLKDDEDKPLSNQPIELYLDNRSIRLYLTNENGMVSTTLNMTQDVGIHEIKALYRGSSIYQSSSTVKSMQVLPSQTKLYLTVPSVLYVDEEAIGHVKLEDGQDYPIKDATILLYSNDRLLSEMTTNTHGEVDFPFTLSTKGEKIIRAVFSGNLNYGGVEKEEKLKVIALQAQIAIQAPSLVWKGDTVNFRVELTDELEHPISNAPIEVEIFQNGVITSSFGLETDAQGVADGNFESSEGGELKILARYIGNEQYTPIEAYTTLTISESSILVLIVIPIIGAIGAFIAVIFWRRGTFSQLQNTLNKGIRREKTGETKPCVSCGRSVPIGATFCDQCGSSQYYTQPQPQAPQEPSPIPQVDRISELDERVFSYIQEHKGEISISKSANDLDISREDLLAAIDRLQKAGRMEQS